MSKSGIYVIENLVNHKKYIGQSVNLVSRKNNHIQSLRNKKHHNSVLQKDFDKYGEKNFKYNVIEYCSEKELDKKEKFYISLYECTDNTKGYNKYDGGNTKKHLPKSTKEKLTNANKGMNNKLTENHVRLIKTLYMAMFSEKFLAELFGVTISTINKITRCKNWAWIYKNREQEMLNVEYKKAEMKKANIPPKVPRCVSEKLRKIRNDEIVKLFQQGYTKQEIMEKCKISASVYISVVHDEYNKRKQLQKNNAIEMRKQGYKVKEIAEKMNLHRGTITEWTKHLLQK